MSSPQNAPQLPENLDAEEHVLCAMMTSSSAIEAVRSIVDASDFSRFSHGRTYRVILDLADLGITNDPAAVVDELRQRKQLEGEYTREHVLMIANLMHPSTNAAFHAEKIVETARFRDLIAIGQEISQLGWDAGDFDTSRARAQELVTVFDERRSSAIPVESWKEFEAQAHDDVPVLVEGLWPEAALGFIAAGPKKGKTWVALALAIAVSAGKPFLNQIVPAARPVLYVALEGHRSGLRARVGAIARGMGLDPDPDGPDLLNLRFIYKPRGLNLADPTWANRLRQSATSTKAALVIIDVLRASARIRENQQEDFTSLAHNLAPITQDGCSLGILHHFTKLSEISKERDPGERMSGSGAMFGALDVGLYITGSHNNARDLRLEFDVRDLAGPEKLSITLEGTGTGPNGGFGYRDTAAWRVLTDEEVAADELKAPAEEIYDWIVEFDGNPTTAEICFAMGITDNTLRARRERLEELGIEITGKKGRPTVYRAKTVEELAEEATERDEQLDIPTTETDHLSSTEPTSVVPTSVVETEETSGLAPHHRNHRNQSTTEVGKRPEQDFPTTSVPNSPTESALAGARETPSENGDQPNERLTEQRDWITNGGWITNDLDRELLTRFPTTGRYDLEPLRQHARECEQRELGATHT